TDDEQPVLSIFAAIAQGVTTVCDGKDLGYKESDRTASMAEGLRQLGIEVEAREDRMTIQGGQRFKASAVKSYADHRVAMSFAVAGLCSEGSVEIDDVGCVDLSFLGFFDLLVKF